MGFYIPIRSTNNSMNYKEFLDKNIPQVPPRVEEALRKGAQDPSLFITFEEATKLMESGYHEVETGYCMGKDGSAFVNVLTDMPGVTPAMWNWWFGWHGDDISRYELWHPRDHLDVHWADKINGKVEYIGRTSVVKEYIGKKAETIAISFFEPSSIGLPNFDANDPSSSLFVFIKAGPESAPPIHFSRLIHQIRPTKTGSEMRSRFWLAGPYITAKGGNPIGKLAAFIGRRVRKTPELFARDLLTHCSEEMTHLASFLPQLYEQQAKKK